MVGIADAQRLPIAVFEQFESRDGGVRNTQIEPVPRRNSERLGVGDHGIYDPCRGDDDSRPSEACRLQFTFHELPDSVHEFRLGFAAGWIKFAPVPTRQDAGHFGLNFASRARRIGAEFVFIQIADYFPVILLRRKHKVRALKLSCQRPMKVMSENRPSRLNRSRKALHC